MSTLVCPYCYLAFREKEIVFRCSGLRGPGGKPCSPERDTVLTKLFDDKTLVPPAFAADGRKLAATHKKCGAETRHRICPHCHSQLPVHFGKVDSRIIAMIGAKESGKTVYMTVLLHELIHRIGRRFDAAIVGSDDKTRERFARDFEDRLYTERRLPATTMSAGADTRPRQPLVFKISLDRPGRFRTRGHQTITSFFDTAGEDLNSAESVERNARYLRCASGVILLLDPLQMRGAREAARPGIPMPQMGPGAETPFNVLARVTDLLKGGQRAGKAIRTPIAVAFSKIDALWDTFDEGSPLKQEPADRPSFDLTDSLAVHEHVRALLDEWEGQQIDQLLRKDYASYRYFGLSALGEPPDGQKVSDSGLNPHRVGDPFLWLLSEFGVIPTNREA